MRPARAIIADLIGAIEDVDPRMRYVNAQIDRATLAEARKFITQPQPNSLGRVTNSHRTSALCFAVEQRRKRRPLTGLPLARRAQRKRPGMRWSKSHR